MVNPTSTTTYTVTGLDANGCADTAQVTIYVNPIPNVLFGSTPSECGDTNGVITVVGPTAGTGPFTYSYNSQTVTMPLTSLAPGSYNISYTDANGCSSMTGVTVFQQNTAGVSASANPTFGTYPLPVTFGAQGSSSGVNNFVWTFGDASSPSNTQNPSHTYGAPGVYEVVVIAWNDNPLCAVSDTIYIEVVEQATLVMPNVFTPNADGTNDQLAATISGVKEINIEIFNRWGNVVYSGTQSGISPVPQDLNLWDGKSNGGKVCEDGVYYYVLTAMGYDTKAYPMQGFFQLITTP
jgi:gliding motility-associated-like protein